MTKSRLLVSGLITATVVLYPVIVYVGLRSGGLQMLPIILILLFSARLAFLHGGDTRRPTTANLHLLAVLGIVLALLSIVSGSPNAMLYYPVTVNAALLAVFVISILRPPSIIERLARLTDKDLPDSAAAYTRKVTIAWAFFFFVNGTISLWTVLRAPLEIWTFYNGFISYVLMAGMFLGELILRRRTRRRDAE